MLLKSVYEVALHFGYSYDTEEEKYFILKIIQGALAHGRELDHYNSQLNDFIDDGLLPESYDETAQIRAAAETMNIRYPAKANMDAVKNVKFKVEKKSTVMQAMQIFCNVNDIPLNVDTTNNIIEGINNVNNGDFNAKYVWKFKVNGELCKASPVDKILKSGDILQWIYTKK